MFSCIHFPVWLYPPRIMKNLYFILVKCMGWQVCHVFKKNKKNKPNKINLLVFALRRVKQINTNYNLQKYKLTSILKSISVWNYTNPFSNRCPEEYCFWSCRDRRKVNSENKIKSKFGFITICLGSYCIILIVYEIIGLSNINYIKINLFHLHEHVQSTCCICQEPLLGTK